MMGGSRKLGRGGGGNGSGAGNRSIPAPPVRRPSPAAGRLSLGGAPRVRGSGTSSSAAGVATSTSSPEVEESFSLVRENPLNFAMAIKLAPDLVEEIKRVEAQGYTARIKFDANPNNSNGNVINVGDKNFNFTWSKEIPDLCDIYEERQSGEDRNGLLVESGTTWRKLNVQRVLDESTQNHVKMRSEEAERKQKSRKAIVLEHQNSSMKKALVAAESNQWRNLKYKKEPPSRKLKSEPPTGNTAVGPHKSMYKAGLSTTTPSKGKPSGSPLSSLAELHGTQASPLGSGNLVKEQATIPDVRTTQNINKTSISDKEMQSRVPSSSSAEKHKNNHKKKAEPSDLRSSIISLLLEHQPKGMSLKALEKAIGDTMAYSARQIEPILKQVATFQAPGRYFLKPGVEMESFKKPPSESGSSPQTGNFQSPAPQKFDQLSAQDPSFSVRTSVDVEEQPQLKSMPGHAVEKVDILQNSPDKFSEKKVSDNSEGLGGSSSDSGSESDSESDGSDSGSDSPSHSRSKSKSSSESESDASSSSKQASDEDVDIMSSDDGEDSKNKLPDSEPVLYQSPVQLRHRDSEIVDIGNYEKQDNHVSDVVEIEKDSPEDNHAVVGTGANYLFPNEEVKEPVDKSKHYSSDYHEPLERQVNDRDSYGGPNSGANEAFMPERSASQEKSLKGKSKKRFDDKHSDERPPDSKRLKSKNMSQLAGTISSLFGESLNNSSPDNPLQSPNIEPFDQMTNEIAREGIDDPSLHAGFNIGTPNISSFDSRSSQRSFEASERAEVPIRETRPGKHDNSGRSGKYSERSSQNIEGQHIKKSFNMEPRDEDALASERSPTKFSAEGIGDKRAELTESLNKNLETQKKLKEAGPHSNMSTGYTSKETNASASHRPPPMNGLGRALQREHSDLEIGEFREPLNDENSGPKKKFERKSSDYRPTDSEGRNSDSSKGKSSKKIASGSRKMSPPTSETVVSGVPERPSKRKAPDHYGDDLARTHNRATRPLPQQRQSLGDHAAVASQHNKVSEMSNKSRYGEAGMDQESSLEAYGKTSKKASTNAAEQLNDSIPGSLPPSLKEGKKHKPNKAGDSNRRKDTSLAGNIDGGQRRRESSSDENSCSYTKYEKEEPELKGPIKDISQYREYVKEYQEKYESYCSLNKILESYRNEFSNFGKDLETYKGRDMKKYQDVVAQMKSSFRQCGERHKRLKKIFIVLYEELKHLKQMIKDYAAPYTKGSALAYSIFKTMKVITAGMTRHKPKILCGKLLAGGMGGVPRSDLTQLYQRYNTLEQLLAIVSTLRIQCAALVLRFRHRRHDV